MEFDPSILTIAKIIARGDTVKRCFKRDEETIVMTVKGRTLHRASPEHGYTLMEVKNFKGHALLEQAIIERLLQSGYKEVT